MKHVFFYIICIVLCCTSICFSNNVNIEVSITGPSTGYIGQNLTYNATVNVSALSSDVEWFIDNSDISAGEGFTFSFTPKTQTESGGHSIKAKVFGAHDSTPIYYTISLPNAYMWSNTDEILVGDTVDLQCRPSDQNVSFEEIAPPSSGETIVDPTTDWANVTGHDYWARTKQYNVPDTYQETVQYSLINSADYVTINVYSRNITFTKSPDVSYIIDDSDDAVTITATGYLLDDIEWELYKDGSLYSTPSGNNVSQTITADTSMSPGKYVYKAKRQSDSDWHEADPIYITDYDVTLNTYSPTELPLGENLTVSYSVTGPSGFSFDALELLVYNNNDTLVYKRTDLVKTVGSHSTSWIAAKWNQGDSSGSYANPKNGPYTIKVLGTEGTCVCGQYEASINTKLIIEADITDKVNTDPNKVDTTAIPAGLGDIANALDVIVTDGNETKSFDKNTITITDITDGKHIEIDNSELNNLDDGQWNIQIKDVRDEIGNFFDDDESTETIDHKNWNITIN